MKDENENSDYCPRCIEDYEVDDVPCNGTKVPSDCMECGVCGECEHMYGCSQRDDYSETPIKDRYVKE